MPEKCLDSSIRSSLAGMLLITLAACGGGGSDTGTPAVTAPALQGAYSGSLTGSTSSAFQMLVLDNGDVWALYGTQSATSFAVAGFIQGSGSSSSGNFNSTNTKDFGFAPAVPANTSARYDLTAKTVSGSVTYANGNTGFSGAAIAGSLYNYDTAASLPAVAGTWTLTALTGERIALTVAASGSYTARSSLGCNFSGAITPRSTGKNVFMVSMTFGSAPCALAAQTVTGIAVAYPLANGQTQLLVAAVDGNRSYGAGAFGTR